MLFPPTLKPTLLAHTVAGLLLCCTVDVSKPDWCAVAFVGLVFAETGMLGLAAGLGDATRWRRCGLAAIGLILPALIVVFVVRPPEVFIFLTLVVVTALVAALAFGYLRYRGVIVRRLVNPDGWRPAEGSQFFVRDLLGFTLGVAMIVKLAQTLHGERTLGVVFAFGLTFTAVSIVAAWAALGRRPLWRCPAALALAAGLGAPVSLYRGEPDSIPYFSCMMTAQAATIIASLWPLRRAGYRLIRPPRLAAPAADAASPLTETGEPVQAEPRGLP